MIKCMPFTFFRGSFLAIALIIVIKDVNAQGLQIGDKVPNIEIKRLLNYKSESEELKNLIGSKALLIDFWFSTCTSCFESFPIIDSIQKEFQNELNVLLVTFETKQTTINVFNKIKRVSHVKLPLAFSDTLLALIFPHNSAPHEIWIDKAGIVKAITDHRSITRKNVRLLIDGADLDLPVKKDNMDYSGRLPLISELNLQKTLKYSFFSSHQHGIPALIGLYIDSEDGFLKAIAQNFNFKDLYMVAYNQFGKDFNYNRIVVDSLIEIRLRQQNDSTNAFCYERWWKDTSKTQALHDMQQELDQIFNINSNTEIRNMPCIVLKEIGSLSRFKSLDPSERAALYLENDTMHLRNVNLKYVIQNTFNYGNSPWSPYQFIDDTGYTGGVTIDLPKVFESIIQLNEYLKSVDLEVSFEYRLLDVIVVKEPNAQSCN